MGLVSNTGIVSGISNGAGMNRPHVFSYNGDLFLLDGKAMIYHKWNTNTNTWESNSTFASYDVAPGTDLIAATFEYLGDFYLLLVMSSAWKCYKWNGTQWITNALLKTGLATGTFLSPSVFYFENELYCICGNYGGSFVGYKWNGSTTWASNATIINGLSDLGDYTRPAVFYFEGKLCLLTGRSNGFVGYSWNGTTWISDSNVQGGLLTYSYPHPTVFNKGTETFLILSSASGIFIGFRYNPNPKINDISLVPEPHNVVKFKITLSAVLAAGETLKAWFGSEESHMSNPAYLVELTTTDNIIYSVAVNIEEGTFYRIRCEEIYESNVVQQANKNGTFLIIPALAITTINITNAANYKIFTTPNGHSYNHGLIHYNGYIYGAARNTPTAGEYDIFRVNAADYSVFTQKIIFENKTNSLNRIVMFDQIIICKNFLWISNGTTLIRINPADLDYIVFSGLPQMLRSEPITADQDYIYYSAGLNVYKLDVSKLIESFAFYGYTGAAPVALPNNTILLSCPIIQHHPTALNYVHSAICDGQYLYLSVSTPNTFPSGYDATLDINFCHVQKIRKADMVTVNDVITPKSTDDMAQNGEYLFLAPEMAGDANNTWYGGKWGLFAINKKTFAINYLKALHADHIPLAPEFRAGFGVFTVGDKLISFVYPYKHLVVLNTSQIESWGEYFPVAGATEAVYKFQLNGVNFTAPCNEFAIDNNGIVHLNTWEINTMLFKFNLSQLTTATKTPNIQTTLISSDDDSATVNGIIIDEGQSPITAAGFKYSTNPADLNNDLPADPFSYDFTEALTGLAPGIYYIKAYGTNTEGTFYGNTVIFSTYNAVTLAHDNAIALLSWLSKSHGHSIRCIQDAPGTPDGTTGTATDQDGNIYNTIVINQKRWFVENLKTKKYRDGSAIPEVTAPAAWAALETGANCSYNNNPQNV